MHLWVCAVNIFFYLSMVFRFCRLRKFLLSLLMFPVLQPNVRNILLLCITTLLSLFLSRFFAGSLWKGPKGSGQPTNGRMGKMPTRKSTALLLWWVLFVLVLLQMIATFSFQLLTLLMWQHIFPLLGDYPRKEFFLKKVNGTVVCICKVLVLI